MKDSTTLAHARIFKTEFFEPVKMIFVYEFPPENYDDLWFSLVLFIRFFCHIFCGKFFSVQIFCCFSLLLLFSGIHRCVRVFFSAAAIISTCGCKRISKRAFIVLSVEAIESKLLSLVSVNVNFHLFYSSIHFTEKRKHQINVHGTSSIERP